GISGGLHASHLNIAQKESVRKFLAGVRPFVIVKKQATEDTWRYLTLWPAMLHGTAARIASNSRWDGHTKQTREEFRARQRQQKWRKYWTDPVFRQRCIDNAIKRAKNEKSIQLGRTAK